MYDSAGLAGDGNPGDLLLYVSDGDGGFDAPNAAAHDQRAPLMLAAVRRVEQRLAVVSRPASAASVRDGDVAFRGPDQPATGHEPLMLPRRLPAG
jgi:hypothetical protein